MAAPRVVGAWWGRRVDGSAARGESVAEWAAAVAAVLLHRPCVFSFRRSTIR